MDRDLKAQNLRDLTAIYGGTLFLIVVVQWSVEEAFKFSLQLGQQALSGAAIASFGGVLSNFLPNRIKHILIYHRLRNVISGYRCRSICLNDPRLLSADLEKKWPSLFFEKMQEKDQNDFWYREIYRTAKNEPEVVQAHRNFLLYRDTASGLSVLLLGLLLWNIVSRVVVVPALSMWSIVTVLVVVLILCQAARQSGDRMVANAVAVAIYR